MPIRTIREARRGCGHRKAGGGYLSGELGEFGTLPAVVEIDPPIPIDQEITPFSRGTLYILDLDAG